MEFIDSIRKAGVIGAGGAGFPSYAKYTGDFETLIINGAECEPLLRKDQYLMKQYPQLLVETLAKITELFEVKGFFTIKEKYSQIRELLQKEIDEHLHVELYLLDDYYPAGDEQEIVKEVTGKVVPPGGIPADLGVITNNVETLFNMAKAMKDDSPVTETFVTVTGEVSEPATLKVPVGSRVKDVLEYTGEVTTDSPEFIDGGPMMGVFIEEDAPIKKITSGLLVLPRDHKLINPKYTSINKMLRIAASVCTQCRMCTDLCPRYLLGHPLEPHKIMRTMSHAIEGEEYTLKTAFLCCECNICEEYACPMRLSPKTINQYIQEELTDRDEYWESGEGDEDVSERITRSIRRIPPSRIYSKLNIEKYKNLKPSYKDVLVKPSRVRIPLDEHVGKPASPIVEKSELVKKGEKIAESEGEALGVPVHSSITGVVEDVEESYVVIRRS